MTIKEITLFCEIPDNVTPEDLEKFLDFKFMGHGIADDVLSKFKHEELDVDHILIE